MFPQLQDSMLYSAVYCEAMHNDARTGTAIAMTAAQHGATIANYVEMTGLVKDANGQATGVTCEDKISGDKFTIKAAAVVLATGAFLDSIRRMEEPDAEKAVAAAAGVHIVLPGYFTPGGMGLCNLRTKRGATMYFLPWQGHTIVGSTDKKCDATSSPAVTEDEIQYLVNEAASCLSKDIRVRRSDVLSAWQGWRPLYRDPNAPPDAPVSRHHAIGVDPKTGVIFICGGKWSTYRAMAEELIDKVILEKNFTKTAHVGPCITKAIKLAGGDGYHDLLYVQLVQKYGVTVDVARHLCRTYGAAAFAVCEQRTKDPKKVQPVNTLLVPGYPFIEAEIEYAAKNEYAVTAKDILTLRMRLAYLNSEAAKSVIPRVVEVMGDALGWSKAERKKQTAMAEDYVGQFGGPVADKKGTSLRARTYTDLLDIFTSIDTAGTGYIDEKGVEVAAAKLGFPFKDKADAKAAFLGIDKDGAGRITEREFIEWWNKASTDEFSKKLHKTMTLTAANEVAIDRLLMKEDERKSGTS
jgi:glycerol-3-phosphate dehydrogenase